MAATDTDSPEQRRPTRVFVSYAHEDRPRAQAVIRALEAAGFEVWWDGLIVAGTAFAATTEQALEAAGAVVVLWSHAANGSHWVRDEATRGRDRGCLVPVSLDGSEPPLGFRQYLVIDLSKWHGKHDAAELRAVIHAVQTAKGEAQASTPAPSTAGRGGPTRRQLIIGGAALAVAALGGGSWYAWRRGFVGPHAVDANSVVVLPFANLSGDPGQTYFSDGMSAEMRGALARDRRLRVIGQVSSDAFRDGKAGAIDIARTLGVAYLLDGNVRLAGKKFRIEAELIDGQSGFSRWEQTFDRPMDNIFEVQREIASAVLSAVDTEMVRPNNNPAAPVADAQLVGGTTNVAAFDAYLRGRAAYAMSEGEESDRRALAEFDAAIAVDPKFAAAHAARSRALLVIANQYVDADHTRAIYDDAVRAAETATELAPDLADAQSTLAFTLFQGRLDVRGARQHYDLSRRLGEGDATVMGRFALYCALTGRAAEAQRAMMRALELDPLNPLVHRAMGSVLYDAHRYADAVPYIDHALTLNRKLSGAHAAIGYSLLMLGRTGEARDAFALEPHKLVGLPGLAIAEKKLHHEAAAQAAMQQLKSELGDSALYQQAEVEAQWGDSNAALGLLSRAHTLGDSGLIYARTDPLLEPLRGRPDFAALLRQLGFD